MTLDDVKRNIWRNAASNYLCLGLRLVLGMLLFRMLYRQLTREEFGFWALLWSVFGYGVLLDFGFGFTAQKRVAELSVRQEWDKLSQVLSTIFFSYVGIAAVIIVMGLFGSGLIIRVACQPDQPRTFPGHPRLFLLRPGPGFSVGAVPRNASWPAADRPGQRHLCPWAGPNLVLAALAVHYHWGFKTPLSHRPLCTFTSRPDLRAFRHAAIARGQHPASALLARHGAGDDELLPLRLCHHGEQHSSGEDRPIRHQLRHRVSRPSPLPGGRQGGRDVRQHQPATPESALPVAAHLHARGDRAVLQQLLVNGTRFTVMLATPLYPVARSTWTACSGCSPASRFRPRFGLARSCSSGATPPSSPKASPNAST